METSTWFLIIIVGGTISFFIFYFFFRYTFSMRRQLWNQKKQIALLVMIARKLGVSNEALDTIEVRSEQETDRYLDMSVK